MDYTTLAASLAIMKAMPDNAAHSAEEAKQAAEEAQQILESIPEDYSSLQQDVNDLNGALNQEKNRAILAEDGKAPGIVIEDEQRKSYTASEMSAIDKFTVEVPTKTGVLKEYIAPAQDIFPDTDEASTSLYTKSVGNIMAINGTPSSSTTYFAKVDNSTRYVPNAPIEIGDTVTFFLCMVGNATREGYYLPFKIEGRIYYTDETNTGQISADMDIRNGPYVYVTVPVQKEVASINFDFVMRASYTFDCSVYWAAVINASFTEFDLSEALSIASSAIGKNGITMLPVYGGLKYIADTKTYIDNQVPEDMLTKEDLVYISPEMFGAAGDGEQDDTSYFQQALDEAIDSKKPFRAYGVYLITSPLSIIATEFDAYIHKITYTGIGVALTLSGSYNWLRVEKIYGYNASGSSAFRLETTSELDSSYNEMRFGSIYGYQNAVEFINEYSSRTVYYNRLTINRIYARYGHCFYFNCVYHLGENSFYGKHVSNLNGYFAYFEDGSNSRPDNRFYEFCIENSSKNGVYGIASLINCRVAECQGKRRSDNNDGYIFSFDGRLPCGEVYSNNDGGLHYVSLKMDNALSINDCKNIVKTEYESGNSMASSKDKGFPVSCKKYVLGPCEMLFDYYYNTNAVRNHCPRGKLIVYFNKKGFVPDNDWYHEIAVSEYRTYITDQCFPTIFDVTVSSTIYLDDSYCPVGINKIKIIQNGSAKAVVYDHNNVKVFDGTNLEAGTYVATVNMTSDGQMVIETTRGTLTFSYDNGTFVGMYFIDNEQWTVEKLNIVS